MVMHCQQVTVVCFILFNMGYLRFTFRTLCFLRFFSLNFASFFFVMSSNMFFKTLYAWNFIEDFQTDNSQI